MKRLHNLLAIPCFLVSLSVFADEPAVSPPILKPQTQNDVTFVSGGIGESERNAIQAVKGDYNLTMLFALKGSGEFIADINVRISDAKGNALVETVTDGPYLFVKLMPGDYTVSAEKNGHVMQQKAVVNDRHATSLSFYWPHDFAGK